MALIYHGSLTKPLRALTSFMNTDIFKHVLFKSCLYSLYIYILLHYVAEQYQG